MTTSKGEACSARRTRRRFDVDLHALVLTNPDAGGRASRLAELRAAMENAAITADVRAVPGKDLLEMTTAACGQRQYDVVVAAGGDGTVSAVAAALAGRDTPLGILPTGTMNHFARDLGLPTEVSSAAEVVAAANAVSVDVAEVNGRTFINNCSIGLYPQIIHERESLRQRLGRGKWVAMLTAFLSVFRRYPTVRVRIGIGDQTVLRTTPFVFVGNNRYEMDLTMLGRRQRLNAAELCVCFTNRTGRFGLFRLAVRGLFGGLEQAKDFDVLSAGEVWIETPKHQLRVALDGEVIRLSPPLHYRIRPAALKVFVEPGGAATAPTPEPRPSSHVPAADSRSG